MAGPRKETRSNEECTISVRITPRSSKMSVRQNDDGVFVIHLTAPPVEGAANNQLVRFLANALRMPKTSLEIVSGVASRNKRIRITGISPLQAQKLLSQK